MGKIRILNNNVLKIIAAISMLLDHIGLILFPSIEIFRILGRIAFPIFAFTIAEGAKYTRNKVKYFSMIFGLGAICQIVNYFFNEDKFYMGILITFSLSILLIYLLQFNKHLIFNTNHNKVIKVLVPVITIPSSIVLLYFLNKYVEFDYGFWGCLVPVFTSLVDLRKINVNDKIRLIDNFYIRFLLTFIGVLLVAIYWKGIQYYSLISMIFIFLYNEKRGKVNLKYFFYLFYPLHLVLVYGISMLMYLL